MELRRGWISPCRGCSAFFILRSQQDKLLLRVENSFPALLGYTGRIRLILKHGFCALFNSILD